MTETPPPISRDEHIEHDEDKVAHVTALEIADEALRQAEQVILEGRRRLQASLARYAERTNDPR